MTKISLTSSHKGVLTSTRTPRTRIRPNSSPGTPLLDRDIQSSDSSYSSHTDTLPSDHVPKPHISVPHLSPYPTPSGPSHPSTITSDRLIPPLWTPFKYLHQHTSRQSLVRSITPVDTYTHWFMSQSLGFVQLFPQ